MLFVRSAERGHRSLIYIQTSVEEPLADLGEALEANTAGESLLHRATAVTGEERNALLSQSIATAESAAQAWEKYQAHALHLPGEDDLAAKYERDYEAGKAVAAKVLVPIIQSNQPMPLPPEQVDAADLNRRNLIALRELYEREDREALQALDQRQERERDAIVIAATVLDAMMLLAFGFALRLASRQVATRRRQEELAEFKEFEGGLIKALEFADNDTDAFRVAHRALTDFDPDVTVSMVVADSGRDTFTALIAAPPCGVTSADQCPAFRSGTSLQFSDSDALDTCPTLAAGAPAPCSVTCVPVSVAGLQAAVAQMTGAVGTAPGLGLGVTAIARRLGERLTTMRALSASQRLASRDPLTGLLNRRSFEEAVGRLIADGTSYAVAFADLDHFKLLNDVHGHDAGDRALQAFASTLKASVRPEDIVARWGGEEFVIVLPDCDQTDAMEAMDRARTQLAAKPLPGTNVAVTMSVGVALRRPSEPFEEALARADDALRMAKATGRDRVVGWAPAMGSPAVKAAKETPLPAR